MQSFSNCLANEASQIGPSLMKRLFPLSVMWSVILEHFISTSATIMGTRPTGTGGTGVLGQLVETFLVHLNLHKGHPHSNSRETIPFLFLEWRHWAPSLLEWPNSIIPKCEKMATDTTVCYWKKVELSG